MHKCVCLVHIRCSPLCQQSAMGVANLGYMQGTHEVMDPRPLSLLHRQLVARATFLGTVATITGAGKEEVLSVAKLYPRTTPPEGCVLKRRRGLNIQFIDALQAT